LKTLGLPFVIFRWETKQGQFHTLGESPHSIQATSLTSLALQGSGLGFRPLTRGHSYGNW